MKKKLLSFIFIMIIADSPVFSQTVQVGDVAPDFTAATVNDKDFSLYETVKDSIVVIYFMGYS